MFSDNILADDNEWSKSKPKKLAQTKKRPDFTYDGAYGVNK